MLSVPGPETSLSRISVVRLALPSDAPPVGLEMSIEKLSFGSSTASSKIVTVTVFDAPSPSAHVRMPLSAEKSSPAVAVPDVVV